MAYLISSQGKKKLNDLKKGHLIVYKHKRYKPSELCKILGIGSSTMYRRVENYIDGLITYKKLILVEKKKPKKIDRRVLKTKEYVVDGKAWTAKSFAEFIGLTVDSARVRLVKYEKGIYTKEQLFKDPDLSKVNNYKGAGVSFLDNTYKDSEEMRRKLDAIPGAGTWEEANLNPTTFYSSAGGTGCAKEHI